MSSPSVRLAAAAALGFGIGGAASAVLLTTTESILAYGMHGLFGGLALAMAVRPMSRPWASAGAGFLASLAGFFGGFVMAFALPLGGRWPLYVIGGSVTGAAIGATLRVPGGWWRLGLGLPGGYVLGAVLQDTLLAALTPAAANRPGLVQVLWAAVVSMTIGVLGGTAGGLALATAPAARESGPLGPV